MSGRFTPSLRQTYTKKVENRLGSRTNRSASNSHAPCSPNVLKDAVHELARGNLTSVSCSLGAFSKTHAYKVAPGYRTNSGSIASRGVSATPIEADTRFGDAHGFRTKAQKDQLHHNLRREHELPNKDAERSRRRKCGGCRNDIEVRNSLGRCTVSRERIEIGGTKAQYRYPSSLADFHFISHYHSTNVLWPQVFQAVVGDHRIGILPA